MALLSSFHYAKTLLSLTNTRFVSLNELPFETKAIMKIDALLTARNWLHANIRYCLVE
jgi:hypothetical protein